MLYHFLIFLEILLFPFLASSQCKISGSVTGNVEKRLTVFYPFNGFSNSLVPQDKSSIYVDSVGKFSFKLDLETPTFITLFIDNNPIWLIVDNKSHLQIKIHLDSIIEFKILHRDLQIYRLNHLSPKHNLMPSWCENVY